MTEWPTVSVLITGNGEGGAAQHTAASVRSSDYAGELHVLTGSSDTTGSPATIANALVGESQGTYLLVLPPGATLDPRCVRLLVARAETDERLAAVVPQWRRPDGAVLEAGSYLSADEKIRPIFQDERVPPSMTSRPYRVDLSAIGFMLIRTGRFFAIGGFNLELDGSPFQAADLALRLPKADGRIEAEPGAIAFAPTPSVGSTQVPSIERVQAQNRFRSAWIDRLNALDVIQPEQAAVRALVAGRAAHRLLWVAPHVPDRTRSGIDARHLDMIGDLVEGDIEVLVSAEQGNDAESSGGRLETMGVPWVAPPPEQRWSLGSARSRLTWLHTLLEGLAWETVLIADPQLAPRVIPLVRALSPGSAVVVDLGSVRFAEAHHSETGRPEPEEAAIERELKLSAPADAVVAVSQPDRDLVGRADPDRAAFVYSALGSFIGPASGPSAGGSVLYIGDLFHRPNVEALEWWLDTVAAQVEARLGYPVPLRVVGRGSETYRGVWNRPGKITLAGWRADLEAELALARMLVIPLTYATGTGGRIAAALAQGVPVVASAPAAAVPPLQLASLVRIGNDAAELAGHIAELLTDDVAWEAERSRIGTLEISEMSRAQAEQFRDWLTTITPADQEHAELVS